MAAFARQPHVSEFLDVVMHDETLDYRIEEVEITATSPLAGRSLADAALREATGALLLTIPSASQSDPGHAPGPARRRALRDQVAGTALEVHAGFRPSRDVRPADPTSREPLARLSCLLGVAADLVVHDGGQLTRHVDPGVESNDSATAPVLAHVLGIIHVAASHAMAVGPLRHVDRPLAVARYSAMALDTLGDVGRGSPMLAAASFAPRPNPASLNERLESGLRHWVTAAQAELNRTVPSTDVIRNVMNQSVHLYAVSARLLETAECAGELAGATTADVRESLQSAMHEMGQADRLWGSVTTAMPPSHEYVAAARELHAALTGTTHDGLHPRGVNEIAENLDVGRAMVDLRYAARDVADLARDAQHLPGQLLRCELLFAPAGKLTPSVERLHERATGRYVAVLQDEAPDLVTAARTVTGGSDLGAQALDRAVIAMHPPAIPVVFRTRPAMAHEL